MGVGGKNGQPDDRERPRRAAELLRFVCLQPSGVRPPEAFPAREGEGWDSLFRGPTSGVLASHGTGWRAHPATSAPRPPAEVASLVARLILLRLDVAGSLAQQELVVVRD